MTGPASLDLRGTIADPAALEPAARHVEAGGVLAYPTDIAYAFGGLCDPDAVRRVRALARWVEEHPLPVLVASAAAAAGLRWSDGARDLAAVFWPGALTLLLSDPDRTIPGGVHDRRGTVAVRVSPHPVVAGLLRRLCAPLTSAAIEGRQGAPVSTAEEALEAAVARGAGREVLVLNMGRLPASGPSTLVDCSGPEPVVLQEGALPLARLRCALPAVRGN